MATESPKVEYGIGLPQAMAERGELLENLIDTSADLVAQEASTETARRWAVHLEQEFAEARRHIAALLDAFDRPPNDVQPRFQAAEAFLAEHDEAYAEGLAAQLTCSYCGAVYGPEDGEDEIFCSDECRHADQAAHDRQAELAVDEVPW